MSTTIYNSDYAPLRVDEVATIRGRLENIRFGVVGRTDPSLAITFPDWSMVFVALRDYRTAKSISIPLGTSVSVKVRCIDEDGELLALAIWDHVGVALPL